MLHRPKALLELLRNPSLKPRVVDEVMALERVGGHKLTGLFVRRSRETDQSSRPIPERTAEVVGKPQVPPVGSVFWRDVPDRVRVILHPVAVDEPHDRSTRWHRLLRDFATGMSTCRPTLVRWHPWKRGTTTQPTGTNVTSVRCDRVGPHEACVRDRLSRGQVRARSAGMELPGLPLRCRVAAEDGRHRQDCLGHGGQHRG